MSENFGVNSIGTGPYLDPFLTGGRQVDSIIVAGSQGVLQRGTILKKTGQKYYIWDNTDDPIAGVLPSTIDTTDGDVLCAMAVDVDVARAYCQIGAGAYTVDDIPLGLDKDSLINFKEVF